MKRRPSRRRANPFRAIRRRSRRARRTNPVRAIRRRSRRARRFSRPLAVAVAAPRRGRSRARFSAITKRINRRSRRSSGGGGLMRKLSLREVFDKPTLTIAAGAVGAGVATSYLLTKFGGVQPAGKFSLPGSHSPLGQAVYQVGIPIGLAMLVKKKSPNLAKGMIIGGLVAGMQSLLAYAMPKVSGAVAPTGAYLDPTGAYLDPTGGMSPPGQIATNGLGAMLDSTPAFSGNAFSV